MTDKEYQDFREKQMVMVKGRNGKNSLRYKPGSKIMNSDGEVYEVQANRSWRKLERVGG